MRTQTRVLPRGRQPAGIRLGPFLASPLVRTLAALELPVLHHVALAYPPAPAPARCDAATSATKRSGLRAPYRRPPSLASLWPARRLSRRSKINIAAGRARRPGFAAHLADSRRRRLDGRHDSAPSSCWALILSLRHRQMRPRHRCVEQTCGCAPWPPAARTLWACRRSSWRRGAAQGRPRRGCVRRGGLRFLASIMAPAFCRVDFTLPGPGFGFRLVPCRNGGRPSRCPRPAASRLPSTPASALFSHRLRHGGRYIAPRWRGFLGGRACPPAVSPSGAPPAPWR